MKTVIDEKVKRLTPEERRAKASYIRETKAMGLKFTAILDVLADEDVHTNASDLSGYLGGYKTGPKQDYVLTRAEQICRDYRKNFMSKFSL